jgi:hypothetical protein
MRRMLSRWLGVTMLCLVIAGLSLSACGKRGNPKPAGDQPVTYPKAYPTQ